MPDTENAPSLTVHVDEEEWQPISSLADAGPDDRVFAVDEQGRVRFGDGAAGRRPPAGAAVTVAYREGAGSAGSVRVSITTSWPPPQSRYLVALTSDGARIGGGRTTDVQSFGARRVNYFRGQLLSATDFQAEQEYLISARHRHNRALHGSGIATGLAVTVTTDGSSAVVVEPGIAIDRHGREIELQTPVSVALDGSSQTTLVILEYVERPAELVPGSTDSTDLLASRIEEGATVRLCASDLVDADGIVVARVVRESGGWALDRRFRPIEMSSRFVSRFGPVLLLLVSSACAREESVSTPVTIWRPVGHWAGEASLQTESFVSTSGSFRVRWTSANLVAAEPGRLTITLHSAVSGRPLVGVVEHVGQGEATAYVAEDPREFFLVVDAERSRWTLELDEGLPGTKRAAAGPRGEAASETAAPPMCSESAISTT